MTGNLQLVVLLHALVQVQAHDERHGGVQEVHEIGGQDGHVDVLPLEGEEQRGQALCHQHQPVVLCRGDRVGREKERGMAFINSPDLSSKEACGDAEHSFQRSTMCR